MSGRVVLGAGNKGNVYRIESPTQYTALLTVPATLTDDAVYNMTVAELKWRWEWDPLREDPRFQQILVEPEPKTIY